MGENHNFRFPENKPPIHSDNKTHLESSNTETENVRDHIRPQSPVRWPKLFTFRQEEVTNPPKTKLNSINKIKQGEVSACSNELQENPDILISQSEQPLISSILESNIQEDFISTLENRNNLSYSQEEFSNIQEKTTSSHSTPQPNNLRHSDPIDITTYNTLDLQLRAVNDIPPEGRTEDNIHQRVSHLSFNTEESLPVAISAPITESRDKICHKTDETLPCRNFHKKLENIDCNLDMRPLSPKHNTSKIRVHNRQRENMALMNSKSKSSQVAYTDVSKQLILHNNGQCKLSNTNSLEVVCNFFELELDSNKEEKSKFLNIKQRSNQSKRSFIPIHDPTYHNDYQEPPSNEVQINQHSATSSNLTTGTVQKKKWKSKIPKLKQNKKPEE